MRETGKKLWIFPDGDLPPPGDGDLKGHEALTITNINDEVAEIELDIYFEDREPDTGIPITVQARRVSCLRLDKPLGPSGYQIPYGQYSLVLRSTVPVAAVFGRLDVRQTNLAYYTVAGFASD